MKLKKDYSFKYKGIDCQLCFLKTPKDESLGDAIVMCYKFSKDDDTYCEQFIPDFVWGYTDDFKPGQDVKEEWPELLKAIDEKVKELKAQGRWK